MARKLTQAEFITKARKVHGDKYDYSKVDYINNKSSVKIFCRKCMQYFLQLPANHLTGHNCSKCYKIMSQAEFIKRAKVTHGNKYGYRLVLYKSSKTPVEIICNKCGKIFKQRPSVHLNGHNKCCYQKHPNSVKSKNQFIKDAEKIHLGSYSYDKVMYKGAHIKVQIYCWECGNYFWQRPNSHLRGYRCTTCHLHFNKGGVTKLGLPLYATYAPQLTTYQPVHLVRQEGLDLLGVECTMCSNIFVPSITGTRSRIASIKGKRHGESHFYCSVTCKDSCKLYNFKPAVQIDPESSLYVSKSEKYNIRKCQKNYLKQLQLDESGYNYCEKCGQDVESVDLHHTLEVAKYGLEAINSSGHILLCQECHKELTKQCRS